MSSKEKILERTIRENEIEDAGVFYSYKLTSRENRNHASFKIPLYSILVSMTDKDGSVTSASVDDAFCDAGQALIFYDKVVRNLATPIDLSYIFEDEMH